MNLNPLICRIRGHHWVFRNIEFFGSGRLLDLSSNVKETFECSRCLAQSVLWSKWFTNRTTS